MVFLWFCYKNFDPWFPTLLFIIFVCILVIWVLNMLLFTFTGRRCDRNRWGLAVRGSSRVRLKLIRTLLQRNCQRLIYYVSHKLKVLNSDKNWRKCYDIKAFLNNWIKCLKHSKQLFNNKKQDEELLDNTYFKKSVLTFVDLSYAPWKPKPLLWHTILVRKSLSDITIKCIILSNNTLQNKWLVNIKTI